MKTLGVIRKVDSLGRVVIPIELRQQMDLNAGDNLEMYLEGESLVMKKFAPTCIFCGGAQGLMVYEGKNICRKCLQILKEA